MQATQQPIDTKRYARCIEVSRRVRWDIDRDVIRGRHFDFAQKFLPDGLSLVDRLDFLGASERRLLSQIQGRTYANMFGLLERFIGAKVLEVTRDHWLGDQTALEALVRFTDENLSPLYKDIFFFHWKEESQHAILDELEWQREDAKLDAVARDAAVGDLIALMAGVDGFLRTQAEADVRYFGDTCGRAFAPKERTHIHTTVLAAYRWQYIVSGVADARFTDLLTSMVSKRQAERIHTALAPLMG